MTCILLKSTDVKVKKFSKCKDKRKFCKSTLSKVHVVLFLHLIQLALTYSVKETILWQFQFWLSVVRIGYRKAHEYFITKRNLHTVGA